MPSAHVSDLLTKRSSGVDLDQAQSQSEKGPDQNSISLIEKRSPSEINLIQIIDDRHELDQDKTNLAAGLPS
jgi:hypothetical protein